ncbi:hypothetical protein [Streptomyces lydicus]|uniref:hypothetical protein n=1 Tax=Streptomyces lydicus TaxID=47763 RepID=UPI003798D099
MIREDYYADTAHFRAACLPPCWAFLLARWINGQQATRGRWRTLVTSCRDQLHAPR